MSRVVTDGSEAQMSNFTYARHSEGKDFVVKSPDLFLFTSNLKHVTHSASVILMSFHFFLPSKTSHPSLLSSTKESLPLESLCGSYTRSLKAFVNVKLFMNAQTAR